MSEERYSRQALLSEIGEAGQEKINNARILVIGAGGLGTPVLQYLTGAGVKELCIFDSDKVELSNLHRQICFTEADLGKYKADVIIKKLKALNSNVKLTSYKERFTVNNAELVKDYDLIIDGSDNFGTRYLLNDISCVMNIPLVSASIFGFEGQLSVFNYKGRASLRCLYKTPPSASERPACNEAGVLGPSVGVLGSLQALEAIKVILENESVLSGKILILNLLTLDRNLLEFDKDHNIIGETKILKQEQYEEYNMCSTNDIPQISYVELKKMQAEDPNLKLLDVRTYSEREEFNIEGDHIPLQELAKRASEVDFKADMVVYCKAGGRSAQAIEFFKANGYAGRLYNLKDGITPLVS